MVHLKIFLCGIGGAVLASVLWIAATLVLPIFVPYVIARVGLPRHTGIVLPHDQIIRETGGGSFGYVGTGGSSGYVGSGSILIAALIGFIIAFAWTWHRLRAV